MHGETMIEMTKVHAINGNLFNKIVNKTAGRLSKLYTLKVTLKAAGSARIKISNDWPK